MCLGHICSWRSRNKGAIFLLCTILTFSPTHFLLPEAEQTCIVNFSTSPLTLQKKVLDISGGGPRTHEDNSNTLIGWLCAFNKWHLRSATTLPALWGTMFKPGSLRKPFTLPIQSPGTGTKPLVPHWKRAHSWKCLVPRFKCNLKHGFTEIP